MTGQLPRVVVLGDSQLEGLAPHLRSALADQMQIVGTAPMPGATTRVVVDSGKISNYVGSQHPDLVVFVLGGNDTAGATSARATADAMRQAQAGGAHVIWIGPARSLDPEVDARHSATSEQQRVIIPQLGGTWLDSRRWANSGWGEDGVHFLPTAYAAQARAIAEALRPGPSAGLIAAVAAGTAALVGAAALAVHLSK